MSDYRWRFVGAVAGLVTLIAVGLATLAFTMHDVRVVTRTVEKNLGKPTATIQGAQLNAQLQGWTCDVWQTESRITFVCHP